MAFAAHLTSPAFKENAKEALADPQLQSALQGIEPGIVDRRRAGEAWLPAFQALTNSPMMSSASPSTWKSALL